ncbi:MAG: GNAT family N-acetyltransferase [Burkholderiales bacterium]|uniref:GNAT family N-acetyltransferase n=1 Tax=Inhella sp. TaxID=1921806 RepID=UPI001AC90972|nr:GNAT family N-acetyltransferase [Burkholderiales bacterium]
MSLVYDATPVREPAVWPPGFRFTWTDRLCDLDIEARQRLVQGGGQRLLADLDADDALYVVWADERPASWGAAPRGGRQAAVLGLPSGSRMIGLCETHPAFRGLGLYLQALRASVQRLREAGEQHIYIEVLEANAASIRGIERAGFASLGRMDARIYFDLLVLRNGRIGRL